MADVGDDACPAIGLKARKRIAQGQGSAAPGNSRKRIQALKRAKENPVPAKHAKCAKEDQSRNCYFSCGSSSRLFASLAGNTSEIWRIDLQKQNAIGGDAFPSRVEDGVALFGA
jgi:hypothetical protein